MTLPRPRWVNRLAPRMAIPIIVTICLVGVGLYFFVLRSVSSFADEQIRASLIDIAGEVYNVCDENFSELMQSGQMGETGAVTIKKAYTLGAIEDFLARSDAGCLLQDADKEDLLRIRLDPDLLDIFPVHPDEGPVYEIHHQGKKLYFYHFAFKPWGWHVDLIKDMEAYSPLISRVKKIYLVTGALLAGGLALILLLQDRLFRRPLNRIIDAVHMGQAPDSEKIYEFAFLSHSIANMMRSLKERNQWIETLYQIAITHRGQTCFEHLAVALAEALQSCVLIVAVTPMENQFRKIAWAERTVRMDEPTEPFHHLPLEKIVSDHQSVIVPGPSSADPHRQPVASPGGPTSYAGVPVISRENKVIGVVNAFGGQRAFDEWGLNRIKTICQIVAVELEFYARENDRLRLESQLQKSQKMEAIGTLAGGVAHDLNNILSGIVGYPDLLLMDLPRDSPMYQPIVTIKQSGERAATIVQDLLTLARRGVAISEVVNLNAIIDQQVNSPEFEKLTSFHPQATVGVHLQSDLLNIKGSATHLAKTIMNLISNAAEAMPEGGQIRIATENCYVDRPLRGYDQVEEGEYVKLTVTDTGIGISDRDRDRIFEPFYTKKVMGRSGTGLGMAVVWGTIKDHGGYINLDSIEGRGTTFTLYFPVTRERMPTEPAGDKDGGAAYLGRGESILVVDDVREQRELAVSMLSRLNYSVTAVASGEAAIAYLEGHCVDLLILDMIMDPGMDGLETYRNVVEQHPGQKAIITSGFSETGRVRTAQRIGAGQYIKKPYTLEKIGLAARSELDKANHQAGKDSQA